MGLPLWPNYKEEEQKARIKNAVKTDPTAASRSSIRRRVHRAAGDGSRSQGLTGARAQHHGLQVVWGRTMQEPAGQGAPPAAVDDPVSRSSGPPRSAQPSDERVARERQPPTGDERSQIMRSTIQQVRMRSRDFQERAQRVGDELQSRLRDIPSLRRETTRSSGFPGPEARPATLPTPPLEGDQSGSAPNRRLPSPPSAPRHGDNRPEGLVDLVSSAIDYLEATRRDTNGLGDRARSISPGDNTGDHWEIIRTTIPEDEALASADSSFAGTVAADSLASTDPARTIGDDGWPSEYTSATEPTQDALHEPQTEECWDFYSESDDADDVDTGLHHIQTDTTVPQQHSDEYRDRWTTEDRRALARSQVQRLRRLRAETQHDLHDRRSRNRQNDTGSPSPGTQRPDRYSAELLQRSRDVANDVREFVRREALNHRSPAGTRPTQIADTRSDMQSSADLLGTFSESMRHDDNDLEAMRGIVQRMVAREDIPDEFWMSAGLSRDAVRGAVPAVGRPSTINVDMRAITSRDLPEPDGYPPSD